MPTYVKETKYVNAHWKKTVTEYRVTLYDFENDEWLGDCDHSDKKADAVAAAKKYFDETGLPALVERLVWTLRTWDISRPESWDDWQGFGPTEKTVWKSPGFPLEMD